MYRNMLSETGISSAYRICFRNFSTRDEKLHNTNLRKVYLSKMLLDTSQVGNIAQQVFKLACMSHYGAGELRVDYLVN
jgi:hypothetical protein